MSDDQSARPDRTRDILASYLDRSFYCAASGKDAPREAELGQLAERLGCVFPPEFIAHSTSELGGLYVEVVPEVWPRPKLYSAGPFWSSSYAMFVYSASERAPEWMRLECAALELRAQSAHRAIPFLKVQGGAEVYCFEPRGSIVLWDQEIDALTPFTGTFWDALERELRALRQRKDRKVAEQRAAGIQARGATAASGER